MQSCQKTCGLTLTNAAPGGPQEDTEVGACTFLNTLCIPYIMFSKLIAFTMSPLRHGHQCLVFWIACQLCIGKLESTCRMHPIFGPYLIMNLGYVFVMFLVILVLLFFIYPPLYEYATSIYSYANYAARADGKPFKHVPKFRKFCFRKKELVSDTRELRSSSAPTLAGVSWIVLLMFKCFV